MSKKFSFLSLKEYCLKCHGDVIGPSRFDTYYSNISYVCENCSKPISGKESFLLIESQQFLVESTRVYNVVCSESCSNMCLLRLL